MLARRRPRRLPVPLLGAAVRTGTRRRRVVVDAGSRFGLPVGAAAGAAAAAAVATTVADAVADADAGGTTGGRCSSTGTGWMGAVGPASLGAGASLADGTGWGGSGGGGSVAGWDAIATTLSAGRYDEKGECGGY